MDQLSVRTTVLSQFPAEDHDHFGKVAFRRKAKKAGGKPGKTFLTLWLDEGFTVLMLTVDQQAELLDHRSGAFERHPSKWGDKGATIMRLDKVNERIFLEAVTIAFSNT